MADAKSELTSARDWGTLMLGAWALSRYARGELDREAWEELLSYLSGPFETFVGLVAALSAVWDVDGPINELEQWELDERLARSRSRMVVGSNARENAVRWAVLLLLRRTPKDSVPTLALTGANGEFFADKLLSAVASVEGDAQKWDVVVGGHLDQKALNLRSAVGQAVSEARRVAADEIAAAPVSEAMVAEFAKTQEQAFAHLNRVREFLLRGGALNIEVTPAAFENLGPGDLLNKRLFVGPADHVIVIDRDRYGRHLAADQQAGAYRKLRELAAQAPEATNPAASVLAAVDELRTEGFAPDVILVPDRIWARPFFAAHPEFTYAPRATVADEKPVELGYLAGIPVLEVGPDDADSIVVADISKAIRVRERRLPGMTAALLCTVHAIDHARAEELVVELNLEDPSGGTEEVAQQIAARNVEVHVRLESEFLEGSAGTAAVRAAPLPPESQARPAPIAKN